MASPATTTSAVIAARVHVAMPISDLLSPPRGLRETRDEVAAESLDDRRLILRARGQDHLGHPVLRQDPHGLRALLDGAGHAGGLENARGDQRLLPGLKLGQVPTVRAEMLTPWIFRLARCSGIGGVADLRHLRGQGAIETGN